MNQKKAKAIRKSIYKGIKTEIVYTNDSKTGMIHADSKRKAYQINKKLYRSMKKTH